MPCKSYRSLLLVGLFTLLLLNSCSKVDNQKKGHEIESWITTGDRTSLLTKSSQELLFTTDTAAAFQIEVDTTQKFQTIDGFGFALTGGSAYLINQKLSGPGQDSLLQELFQFDKHHIGISYLRISIGSSDLDDHVFTYDDQPSGKKDDKLEKFSLEPDKKDLIPVLKKILAINPTLKIMGSPWSAPSWMKSNGDSKGGSLKPKNYKAYADYFVKYIQAMAKEDIPIDAITLQNEPENPNNNPSMVMTAAEEAVFIKNNLGPAFQSAGIKTKIVVFDHNCDHPEYPVSILNDVDAKKYIDGSAFHMYGGEITALSVVHQAHPDRNLYFTEQWTSGKNDFQGDLLWHVKTLIIGASRNWSRNVLEWNLAADPIFNPHTDGGCTECMGALTIGDSIKRNVSYYVIGHASKFVRPGSVRISSTDSSDLPNVAFLTPEGKKVLIVANEAGDVKKFAIKVDTKSTTASLPPHSVGTFVW